MTFRYSCDIIDKTETFIKKEKDEKTDDLNITKENQNA
jgi:hypothetical protein